MRTVGRVKRPRQGARGSSHQGRLFFTKGRRRLYDPPVLSAAVTPAFPATPHTPYGGCMGTDRRVLTG
ncbi:hypothetical protein CU280_15070 [Yersinia mollaretii]|nr:hypothetical protein CU280_15070 [Yersinia mollaretii]